MTLVLSLFPGIGLLDRAFELEGFTVVRGPDVLWCRRNEREGEKDEGRGVSQDARTNIEGESRDR